MAAPSHLKSLQAIEAALRLGSLAKAAEHLAITPAAVGQRIKALEDYLGLELILRGRSGLQPTPALGEALPHLQTAFRELAAFSEQLELQRGQEIHLAAPSDFVDLWLAPRFARFRSAYPQVLFCINGVGDAPFRVGRLDCSIDFTPVRPDGRSDLLFHDYQAPISSPENAARIQERATEAPLEGFPLLHLDLYRDDPAALGWRDWIAAHGVRRTAPERGIRFRRMAPAVDAVLSNAGLMICGLAMISGRIDDGRLRLPYPAAAGGWTAHAYQARFASSHGRPQLERFRRWLLDEGRETEAWLRRTAGRAPD